MKATFVLLFLCVLVAQLNCKQFYVNFDTNLELKKVAFEGEPAPVVEKNPAKITTNQSSPELKEVRELTNSSSLASPLRASGNKTTTEDEDE